MVQFQPPILIDSHQITHTYILAQHKGQSSTMPSTSHLRHQATFAPINVPATQTLHPSILPPQKKRKMTITQTYFLAHTARGKLSHEAARGDHDLRLLVGHANLLDSLTIELQEAEREQDAWFEKTVAESRKPQEPKRVQFKDEVLSRNEDVEIPDASDDDSDADSEDSDGEFYNDKPIPSVSAEMTTRLAQRSRSPPPLPVLMEQDDGDDEDDFYDDVDMENEELALSRVPSHSASPPELVHEDSDDSEDDDMAGPASPPASTTASFALPQDIKAKDFATGHIKPTIRSEDLPMMQTVC